MKTFVLDTNVLIHDPACIFKFQENELVIPMMVLEELDALKTRQDGTGQDARVAMRHLDSFREKGKIFEGVTINEQGGTIRIELDYHDCKGMPFSFTPDKPDNKILSVAFNLAKSGKAKGPVAMVSKDINVRVKSDSLGIKSEDYESDKVNVSDLFKGFQIINVSKEVIEKFYRDGYVKMPDKQFFPNQCILLKVESTGQSALCKYYKQFDQLIPLYHIGAKPWGLNARNLEQRFALELLLSDEIKLVSLVGRAGTGKTLLALAAGLQKVVDERIYSKLLVARPIVPMGKDIGFLPGGKYDKLESWMQPITDNLDFLSSAGGKDNYKYFIDQGLIEVEALTYIRGRSMPNIYFIIDEAQNLTPHEIKTIVTRAGEGSKIILTGDPYQIDNHYLDESSNGLSTVAEKFKNEAISGHITLTKGERSTLATRASELL
ncbi:MAG: PhoH family protein [Candidatus Wallbacteria bacterium]